MQVISIHPDQPAIYVTVVIIDFIEEMMALKALK